MSSLWHRLGAFLVLARRVLLGLLVLGQVTYLGGALLFNVEEAFRPWREVRGLRAWNEREVNGFRQYGQATAQRQRWQLFAPEVWKEFKFLEMELTWEDPQREPLLLRAACEPQDLNAFVRCGGFRFRKYEDSITPSAPIESRILFGEDELEPNELPAATLAAGEADRLLAYLRWRLARFQKEHADWPPPTQVRLRVHSYRIPEPPGLAPWRWQDRGVENMARWIP